MKAGNLNFSIYHNNNKIISIYTKHKQQISACGRSAQSMVKITAQCKAFALYQKEHSQSCSSEELPEATESHCQSWWLL